MSDEVSTTKGKQPSPLDESIQEWLLDKELVGDTLKITVYKIQDGQSIAFDEMNEIPSVGMMAAKYGGGHYRLVLRAKPLEGKRVQTTREVRIHKNYGKSQEQIREEQLHPPHMMGYNQFQQQQPNQLDSTSKAFEMMQSMFGMMMPLLTASMSNNSSDNNSSDKMMNKMMEFQMNSMNSMGKIMQKNITEDIKTMQQIKRDAIDATTEPVEKELSGVELGISMFNDYAPDIIENFKLLVGDGILGKKAREQVTADATFQKMIGDTEATTAFLTNFEKDHGSEAAFALAEKFGLL